MDQTFTTPMMKQYKEIKQHYQDCLLFYRMGDFYELFLEDAHIGAKILDITLTSRAKGKDGRIPMAGVPYHAVDSYLSKLVKAGYNVAICEQVSEPNNRGLVEREVIRVVTPGTVLDEKSLERKENNFVISLVLGDQQLGIAAADISTGYFQTTQFSFHNLSQILRDEIGRINPVECILSEQNYNNPELLKILRAENAVNISHFKGWQEFTTQAAKTIKHHFKITSLESFGLQHKPLAIEAAAALLGFLKTTQKDQIQHIRTIKTLEDDTILLMDRSTMINLELFSTIRDHDVHGTLVNLLDETQTAMGGRMLRTWIRKPLKDKKRILERYDAVDEFLQNRKHKDVLRNTLADISDIERVLSRLSVKIGNARDLINVKHSLQLILQIKQLLTSNSSILINHLIKEITPEIATVITLIEQTLIEEPPVSIREGGMIRPGINKKLDQLRELVGGGKTWIMNMEQDERSRTGIGSLKVRYNKVFGFYIEVSHANAHLVPKHYMRKQTLVNGERFITPDLKKQEEIILTAEEEINAIEYQMFNTLLDNILEFTSHIQRASRSIATIDCILSFAHIAQIQQYTRPTIINSGEIHITNGRHPVVEKILTDTQFVPNNVTLNNQQQLLIITGPNMAGKSVLIRQVALIVLMAQIGSFVPATHAEISLVDRIFVRSGASDVITSGLSTFMVEMVETAYILNHATKHSLIVMDEIGRGTSTYDGISIAWAVAEYLITHEKNPAKTLFATHYHELQRLEEQYPNKIKNYHMEVIEEHNVPVFLHTLLPGGASASFGVAVAKLAGVPESVINKAKLLLQRLEEQRATPIQNQHTVLDQIKTLEINTITPIEALTILSKLQQEINGY